MSAVVTTSRWTRVCPGLYIDPTGRWAASKDAHDFWSLRIVLGWGPMLDGVTMFPDLGSTFYGQGNTYSEVKTQVPDWYPENDYEVQMRAIVEGRA